MIGIINIPCDSPAEYYRERPLRAGEAVVFGAVPLKSSTPPRIYQPDGRPLGLVSQQSQSAEQLWENTLHRSILYRMSLEESRRRSISYDCVAECGASATTAATHLTVPPQGSETSMSNSNSCKSVSSSVQSLSEPSSKTRERSFSAVIRRLPIIPSRNHSVDFSRSFPYFHSIGHSK